MRHGLIRGWTPEGFLQGLIPFASKTSPQSFTGPDDHQTETVRLRKIIHQLKLHPFAGGRNDFAILPEFEKCARVHQGPWPGQILVVTQNTSQKLSRGRKAGDPMHST